MKRIILVCLTMIVVLAACGNKANRVSNKKEVAFGEMMNSGTKWFFVVEDAEDSISKDNIVHTMVKSQNGKISTYNLNAEPLIDKDMEDEVSLGKLSKMSDKEIEEVVEKGLKKTINNQSVYSLALTNYLKNENVSDFDALTDDFNFVVDKDRIGRHEIDGQVFNYSQGDYDKTMKYVKDAQKEADSMFENGTKPYKLNIKVVSDDSGNETEKESFNIEPFGNVRYNRFSYTKADNKNDIYKILSENYKPQHDSYLSFSSGGVKKIYDTNFAYMDSTEYSDTKLVTKVGDEAETVVNDKPDEKYVKRDEEDQN